MFTRRSSAVLLSVALLSAVGCGGTNSASVANALKIVPADALGVMVVKDLASVDALLTRIGKLTGAPVPAALPMAKSQLGLKEGLDEKGTLIVAVMVGKDLPLPQVFICVPVTDYKKFVEQLKPTDASNGVSKVTIGFADVLVAQKGNHAVILADASAATLQDFIAAKGDITASLAPVSAWLGEQDVAAVATSAGVKFGIGPVREGLEKAKKAFPADNPQSEQIQAMFGMYDKLFQACNDELEQLGIGMRGDAKTNMHLTSRWQFRAGGTTAKSLTDIKSFSGKLLSDLPNAPFVFAGTGVMPESLVELSTGMLESMVPAGSISKEQREKLKAAMQESMQGVRQMSMSMGVPKPNTSLYSEMLGVMQMDDAEKYLGTMDKTFAAMNDVYQAAKIPGIPSYATKSATVDGKKAAVVTMDMRASLPPGDEKVHAMLEKMFGKDGKLHITYVATDKNTLLSVFDGPEQAAVKITDYQKRKGSLADNSSATEVTGMLLKDAQWVGLWDIGGTFALVQNLAATFNPDGPPISIPSIPACPPLGFAAHAAKGALETDLVVPADTIKAVAGAMQSAYINREVTNNQSYDKPPRDELKKARNEATEANEDAKKSITP